MKLAKILFLVFSVVYSSKSVSILEYKGIFCLIAASYPFVQNLFITMQAPEKKSFGQGKSTINQAEEQFVRQTFEELQIPYAQSLNIDYAPEWLDGWSSLTYKNTIEVPRTKKASIAYIPKRQKNSGALLDRYYIIVLEKSQFLPKLSDNSLAEIIKNIADAKYIDIDLREALKYKNFILKQLENNGTSSSNKEICQKALINIERALEVHKGAITHEMGHIAHNDGTRKAELKNFCKCILPAWWSSICFSMALQKFIKSKNFVISTLAAYFYSYILFTAVQIYTRRQEESRADNFSQDQNSIKWLYNYLIVQRFYLHQKIRRIIGSRAYLRFCKNQCAEYFFNFMLDPCHPSILARIKWCEKKLGTRKSL